MENVMLLSVALPAEIVTVGAGGVFWQDPASRRRADPPAATKALERKFFIH